MRKFNVLMDCTLRGNNGGNQVDVKKGQVLVHNGELICLVDGNSVSNLPIGILTKAVKDGYLKEI